MNIPIFNDLQNKLTVYYKNKNFASHIFNLLCFQLFQKHYLLITIDDIFKENKIEILFQWINNITEKNYPYQYILNEIGFLSAKIAVQPPVLIPRQETEYMVDLLLKLLSPFHLENLSIVDYCAGSGCIGISLLLELPNSRCTAFEINHQAVQLAAENAIKNKVRDRYKIYKKDIFKLKKIKKYDIIISNPPYIALALYKKLNNNVKQWEDRIALTDDEDGCKFISFLLRMKCNKKNSFIMVIEICCYNAKKLSALAKKIFLNAIVFTVRDQYKKPRILLIVKGKYQTFSNEVIKNYELL